MYLNKRGAALLQVLVVSAVLAGMSAMILRATLSRAATARKTRRLVQAQMIIEGAMAQVNNLWAAKKPEIYARDLDACVFECNVDANGKCVSNPNGVDFITVSVPNADDPDNPFRVLVTLSKLTNEQTILRDDRCKVVYTIQNPEYM